MTAIIDKINLKRNYGYKLSPLRYPGGKTKAIKDLINYVPPTFEEFREPMVGGGSFFLNLKKRYPDKKIWINDINSNLIAFWSILRDRPTVLVNSLLEIKENSKCGKELYKNYKYMNTDNITKFEKAVRFFILNRISYSGLTEYGGYSQLSYEKRFTINSIEKLKNISILLKGVKITSMPYQNLLKTPSSRIFVYLDPPYQNVKSSNLYGRNGKMFDPIELDSFLKKVNFKWLLTYDKSPPITNIYGELNNEIHKTVFTVQYGTNCSKKNVDRKAKKGTELYITNYPISN